MNEEESYFQFELTPEDARVLFYAVDQAIKLWPGSPQRPAEEQQQLQHLHKMFFAMKMDVIFQEDGERPEGAA